MLLHHRDDPERGYIDPDDPGEPAGPGAGHQRVSVTDAEGLLLAGLAKDRRVLEIGTGLGVATNWLAMHAKRVHTHDIDEWVQTHVWPTLDENVVDCHSKYPMPPALFGVDLVFIDAEHTDEALRMDLSRARMTLYPGDMIVVHDADELYDTLDDDEGDWHIIPTRYGLGIHVIP